ncbi:MAG: hypothetical protein Q9203_004678, partial [Teloschistes exilis]
VGAPDGETEKVLPCGGGVRRYFFPDAQMPTRWAGFGDPIAAFRIKDDLCHWRHFPEPSHFLFSTFSVRTVGTRLMLL